MSKLTPGTAQITREGDFWVLRYINTGSFLVGERRNRASDAGHQDHVEFCRERGLRVF